ncbi:hypothetical protein [Shinella sp.]|uniref:hypothetical protein n=1 Tax=Shinella sp. TaxID=1870904 RepID=UPI0028B0E88A|nr:hypothetical protein [Shinella sp.]
MAVKTHLSVALSLFAPYLLGTAQAQSPVAPDEVVSRFAREVKGQIASLNIYTEDFSVRLNRCQSKFGEFADDIYTVWIGWRGFDRDGTAGARLAAIRSAWSDAGWEITRSRELENGGVNLAALEPWTGNTYILDSGFDSGPDKYIVGFFNTPCFSNPAGGTSFGAWKAP